jgi:hypothetical protein
MADNTNRLAGTASLTVDGQSYALRGEFGYRVSTVTRETINGLDGVHGYKELPIPGQMVATLTDASDLSVASLNSMTNVTVIAELANGKTIVGRGMWTVEAQEVKSVDAMVEVKWEGVDVSEN